MALVSLSLSDLFAKTFGYKPNDFEFEDVPGRKETTDAGTAYWSTDKFGRAYYMPVVLDGYELPYPVISFRGRKTIVETQLIERRGTVKEIINIDNYQFSIRGLIVSQDKNYPEAEVRKLRELFEKNEALTIVSAITDQVLMHPDRQGWDKVVITDWEMPETRGVTNVRGYQFSCVSDEPFSLIELA